MKRISLLILLLSICTLAFLTESCKKDESCPTINCNTGTLNEETCNCDCPTGYIGANCEQIDATQIQALLDGGETPKALYDGSVTLEQLYGKMYEGGLIFYLNTNNGTGMVAASEDQSTGAQWGCYDTDITDLDNVTSIGGVLEGSGAEIGAGSSNTDKIINANCMSSDGSDIAAKLCRDKGEEWFLPSIKELDLMYTNLHDKGHGGFAADFYWSSSEVDFDNAYGLSFNGGILSQANKSFNGIFVRAVRAF